MYSAYFTDTATWARIVWRKSAFVVQSVCSFDNRITHKIYAKWGTGAFRNKYFIILLSRVFVLRFNHILNAGNHLVCVLCICYIGYHQCVL